MIAPTTTRILSKTDIDYLEIDLDGDPVMFNCYGLDKGPYGYAILVLFMGDEATAVIGAMPDDPDAPDSQVIPAGWFEEVFCKYAESDPPVIGNAPIVKPLTSMLEKSGHFDLGRRSIQAAPMPFAPAPPFAITGVMLKAVEKRGLQ